MSIEDIQEKLDAANNAAAEVENDTVEDNASEDTSGDVSVGDDDNYEAESSPASLDEAGGDVSGETGRKSILSKITDILTRNQKDETNDPSDDDDVNADHDAEEADNGAGDTTESDEVQNQDQENASEETFVDPRFMIVARDYGWTDAQIVQYASKNGAVDQVQLANHMEEALGGEQESQDDSKSDVELISDEVLAELAKDEDNAPIVNDVVKPLLAKVQELSQALNEVQGKQSSHEEGIKNEQIMQDYDFANAEFDRHAKDFPILGSTQSLKSLPDGTLDVTDPSVQIRREVFNRALQFKQFNPKATMSQAMEEGMTWFRGKHGAEQMERNILAKLEKNSKRVAPKSKGRAGGKKFSDPRDRKRAVINSALEKHGRTMM